MDVEIYGVFYFIKVDVEEELDKVIELFFLEKKDRSDFE